MKKFNNKENIEYQTKCGKKIWHSRNIAVCIFAGAADPENKSSLQFLAVKRGKKVSHSGLWCLPCGYLDWDETIEEAAIRELYEETNFLISKSDLEIYEIDSNPEKNLQNVTVHFFVYISDAKQGSIEPKDLEEIEEIKWIRIEDCDKYQWAFDHLNRVKNILAN